MNIFRKSFITCSLMLAVSRPAQAQTPEIPSLVNTKMKWSQDYDEVLKRAEAEKRPVLIDVTTDWCGWSKKMDRETISTPEVQQLLKGFTLLRLNPEASDRNEKIAKDFGVDGYPHFIIANYKGEDIGHLDGYHDKKDYLEFIKKYLAQFKAGPLGYRSISLEPTNLLMTSVGKIPAPESRPTGLGAFIVLDQCDIRLEADGSAKFLTRTATFVADPEKNDLPEAERRYNSSRQKLKFKSVRVLDVKGQGRELDVKMAEDDHAYSNQNIYWEVRRLSLPLPQLKEGQILDVVEELEDKPVMPGQFYFRWNTGTKILLNSKFSITFPASLKLQRRAIRCKGEIQETRNGDDTITWSLNTSNPEPYEAAAFSPPYQDIWEGYEFFTTCSKDDIAGWYSGLCQNRDVLPAAAKQRVASITKTNLNETAQLQAILNWVTKDIRYVSVAFGLSSHQPHSVEETLANRFGDCKDQSLLLKSLCHQAGIKAQLVLLNSYGADFNETNPSVGMFNHCIVEAMADGQTYYLDPAFGESKLGRVPQSYAGGHALKIADTNGVIVALPHYQPRPEQNTDETFVKLNRNGSATITNLSILRADDAKRQRAKMKTTTVAKVREYIQESYKRSGRKFLDFSMSDPQVEEGDFETRMSYTVPRYGSMSSGSLVFKIGEEEDGDWIAALTQSRTQPFRFYTSDVSSEKYVIELPPGAKLKGLPEDVALNTPFIQANRQINFTNNQITVTDVSHYLEAKLPVSEASNIAAAFQKLHDHRDYSFVVQLPPKPNAEPAQ